MEETEKIVAQVDKIIADIPETDIVFTTIGMGMGMGMSTDSGQI